MNKIIEMKEIRTLIELIPTITEKLGKTKEEINYLINEIENNTIFEKNKNYENNKEAENKLNQLIKIFDRRKLINEETIKIQKIIEQMKNEIEKYQKENENDEEK